MVYTRKFEDYMSTQCMKSRAHVTISGITNDNLTFLFTWCLTLQTPK
jgi:hypothetical protein